MCNKVIRSGITIHTFSNCLKLILAVLWSACALFGAEIELNNGQKLRGDIVKETENEVVLKIFMGSYVEKTVKRSDIKSIKGHDKSASKITSANSKNSSGKLQGLAAFANRNQPLRVLFMAHYGASGALPHFELIYETNYPGQRVLSWFQSSNIKADVTLEWESQTCLPFIRKEYSPEKLPNVGDGMSGGERVSFDWAPNAKNRPALQKQLSQFVAAGPDLVVLAVVSDNSYGLPDIKFKRAPRAEREAERAKSLNNYIAEIRKAGALPVVLMAPQGVRPPKDPKAEHPDEAFMVQMAAALDAVAAPAGLAMTRIMRDQPISFWYDNPAPEAIPEGWYRHPGKCDNYISAAILAIALEDAKLAKTPDPEKINALIARQVYGNNAPTYTPEMLETMHTVAWEVWTEFKAKVATAKATMKPVKP